MIIKVPATSANLGPGFDSIGMAWNIYNTIRFEKSGSLLIEGCDRRFSGADNLAYSSFLTALGECGMKDEPVHISFLKTDIPISRGLGSSAALITAGVAAADAMFGLGLGKDGICRISCSIEGHPDNITPCVYGGMQIASMKDGEVVRAEGFINSCWRFCIIIPDFELSTSEARKALPESYSRSEAVFNISRTGLLIKALEDGDPEMLRYAQDDVIHQPYRAPLITGSETARDIVMSSGAVSICISGAGSSLLCTFRDKLPLELVSREIKQTLPGWEVLEAIPDHQGLAVLS